MKRFGKITILSLLASAFLGAPAFASDLLNDLSTPFQPTTNPFGRSQAVALPASVSFQLKGLLERCVVIPVHQDSAVAVQHGAVVVAGCESVVQARYDGERLGHVLAIAVAGLHVQVVSWDGSDSDGGDEQAIAVYDSAGDRIAAYPSLFVDGNVLDGLAHAVGANLRHVAQWF